MGIKMLHWLTKRNPDQHKDYMFLLHNVTKSKYLGNLKLIITRKMNKLTIMLYLDKILKQTKTKIPVKVQKLQQSKKKL